MDHEGALIAFTLISQLVAGTSIIYAFLFFIRRNEISGISSGFNPKTPELLLIIALLAAIFISLFHLGNIGKAVNALNNLDSSWISREILSLLLLAFGLGLLFIARWKMSGNSGIERYSLR